MRRVSIIGAGGAGKSSFSVRLAERTGLPLFHLDALYWKPGWIEPPKDEWRAIVEQVVSRDRWIADGNFGGTLQQRLEASDTVIFMDTPVLVCLWRLVRRRVLHRGRARPDMTPGCTERLSVPFLVWVAGYPFRNRPAILRKLASLDASKRVTILRSARQAETFLESIDRA